MIYIPQYAEISWQNGQPESAAYGDIYFSRSGGLDETRHVFINGGNIAEKSKQLSTLTVFETGFGTSLNFLACWQEWQKNSPPSARLDYWAVEKFPLRKSDLARALVEFPELKHEAAELIKIYPLPLPGWHRIILGNGRISLTLMFDDIATIMPVFNANIDVWFLDGFAPAKNPDMWCDELFAAMKKLTNKNGCATTFTAAGYVKRNLEAAGFTVEKIAGFGRKREMITAKFNEGLEPAIRTPSSVTIIGAGLAGCAAASALAIRGVKVKIVDSNHAAGMAASGNPAAILKPHYTADWSYAGQFSAIAFQYASSMLAGVTITKNSGGVLELDASAEDAARHNKLAERLGLPEDVICKIDASTASDIAGTKISVAALYHPHAGWYKMADMCQHLLQHENIEFVGETSSVDDSIITYANGFAAKKFLPQLPLEAVRGQMSIVKANAESAQLKTSLHYGGYLSTAHGELHGVGSTFKRHDESPEIRQAETNEVMQKLAHNLPQFAEMEIVSNFAATRCASRDRLPIAGRADENIYVSTAHGSKGAATCLFAGEIIAAQICGEALPINENLYNRTMSPERVTSSSYRRRPVSS